MAEVVGGAMIVVGSTKGAQAAVTGLRPGFLAYVGPVIKEVIQLI